MKKTFKKDLAKEVIDTLNQLLSGHHKTASEKIKKTIKSTGKIISRKFNKELKKAEKKLAKPVKKIKSGKIVSKKKRPVKRKK